MLAVYRTSNKLNAYMCSKGTSAYKIGELYAQKGVKLANSEFFFSLLCFDSRITNWSTNNTKRGREMKLCDPTNNVMFKSM